MFDDADRYVYEASVAWPYADQPYEYPWPRLPVSDGNFRPIASRNPMPEMIRQTVPAETCAELVNDQSGEIVREVTEKTLPFWGLSR